MNGPHSRTERLTVVSALSKQMASDPFLYKRVLMPFTCAYNDSVMRQIF